MATKFFGYLMIVVGIFMSLAGGCLFILVGALGGGDEVTALIPLGIGVALIYFGIKLVLKSNKTKP